MKYKYELSEVLRDQTANFKEFANGAAQASVSLKSGVEFSGLLISDGRYLVAMRNESDLPFGIQDIVEIYQNPDDISPKIRGGWKFWDVWT